MKAMELLRRRAGLIPLAALLLNAACEMDHGLGTLNSTITGDIVFLNPELQPENVESVRVIAAVRVPPESLGDVVFTYSAINLSRDRSSYEIPAPLASYSIVAAIWKEKGKTWNYGNILSFYGFDPISFTVENRPVVLSKDHPIATDIDILVDWRLMGQYPATSTNPQQN
ncbi:hypothetical protein JW992_08260 [candidate division KSB1 bacterium]|nr:hypothetical protein [candidate division KSB1 bacterium]